MERRFADHKLVAGAVLGAVALTCLFIGPVPLLFLVAALALVAAGELLRLGRSRGARPVPVVGLAGVAALFVVAHYEGADAPDLFPAVVAATLIASCAAMVLRRRSEGAVRGVATTVLVVVYVGLMGSYIVAMRGAPDGFRLVLTFGLMVVLNDAGAWAVGGRYGRHRLLASVSPDKTWEGWLGGTTATVAVGIAAGLRLDPPMTLGRGLVLAALVSGAAPLGDLFESLLKRDLSVKDSGAVIPAHGGALDRLDSLIFTAPLFFYAFRALSS